MKTNEHSNPKRNLKITLCFLLFFLIALVIFSVFTYLNNDLIKFKSYINNNEFTEAKILFETKISSNKEYYDSSKTYIGERMTTILEDYKTDKVDIYTSIELIEILGAFDLEDMSKEIVSTIKVFEAENTFLKYSNNEIDAASAIEHIKSFLDNENQEDIKKYIDNLIRTEADTVYNNFNNDTITYNKAMELILEIQSIYDSETISNAKYSISLLNDSKNSYYLGLEYYNNNENIQALKSLQLVIDKDSLYLQANDLISQLNEIVTEYIINESSSLCQSHDYEKAIKLIKTGIELFPDNTQFVTNEEIIKYEMEEYYIANQKLVVKSYKLTSDWLNDSLLEVIVFNNTDEVVKEYAIGYMGFDSNGYPIQSGFLANDFLVIGNATANIQPMEEYGHGKVWNVYNTDVVTVLVCVKTVSYYDNSTWNNPYYDIWVEKYLNKPIK